MKERYVVLKDFLPKHMIKFAMDVWRADEERGDSYTKQENRDITFKNPKSSTNVLLFFPSKSNCFLKSSFNLVHFTVTYICNKD